MLSNIFYQWNNVGFLLCACVSSFAVGYQFLGHSVHALLLSRQAAGIACVWIFIFSISSFLTVPLLHPFMSTGGM